VDGYEIGAGDMHELHLLLELDNASSHLLTFQVDAGNVKREIAKQPLRDLLAQDFDNGGALLGACVGCRTCRPVTIGATDCSSGCPGNYCTVS
jgi:hypothetical protein